MATGIGAWSTTANNNDDADTNINWAEGQAPSTVNDSARAMMAAVAVFLRDNGFIELKEHSHTYASGTSTTVAGTDVTAYYTAGRRVRAVGSGTGTIYGTVVSSSFSTNTTIVYKWDASGALSNEALAISVNLLSPKAMGGLLSGALNTAKGVAVASATSCPIWAANGNVLHITGTTAIEDFGTAPQAGCIRFCIADGALPITRDGTTIETQSGASITFAAGEAFLAVADTTTLTYVYPFQAETVVTPDSFSAHKNNTDQTGIVANTETELTFGTESFDVGSKFASNTWTPSAGKVLITANAVVSAGYADQELYYLVIYKNGSAFKRGAHVSVSGSSSSPGVNVSAIDDANGTDAYTVRIWAGAGSNKTVSGSSVLTYFMGSQL